MPELPEVETTCRGLAPHIVNQEIIGVIARRPNLRWPIPNEELQTLVGEKLLAVQRRGKYLLFRFAPGTIIGHLGMSGTMRIVTAETQLKAHDHIDIVFSGGKIMRFNDPRRFGALLYTANDPATHPLIANLGPEPLSDDFTTDYLFTQTRKRTTNIKTFIMTSQIVVGVGNIYASEALFKAGIRPTTAAGKIAKVRLERLVQSIKTVLQNSILQGGTTLRDFVNSDGAPGYFKQQLSVYGRSGDNCLQCQQPIREIKQAGRATYYCAICQR